MNDKILFLFTSEFPFGKGENFVGNEIEFLGDAFDKIFVVPLENTNGKQREIPQNASVISLEKYQINLAKVSS